VLLGQWVTRPNSSKKPKSVGLFLSRLLSLSSGGRLEVLTESFLKVKDDPESLQSFINNALGEHWKTYKATSSTDELKKAKCEIPGQVVPESADCITIAIDMQQTGFWYSARAWSSRLKDSWLIECGQVGGWEDVETLFFERTWKKDSGPEMGCWRGALDVGGTKEEGKDISRTEEAEAWWVDNRRRTRGRIFLCKGSSKTSMPTKISIGKILETTPSGKKIAHGGLQIVELNTGSLKDLFFHALDQAVKKESGAAFLSADTPDSYFKHITAEVKEHDGAYRRIGRDNHWLDCEMMHRALVSRELHGGIEAVARRHQPSASRPAQPVRADTPENPYLAGSGSGNPYIQR
jgi:phage terminase large subunit GpA-like protein